MGRAIAQFDWSCSELGPIDGWSEALRAAISMTLNSPYAMCMAWGPSLTFFYNDAYSLVLGKRHGSSLGMPIKEVWWDIWETIGPWINQTLAGGTVQLEDTHLVMLRNGNPEDTYWSFAYSPLEDGNGNIQGFLDVCIETTAKVKHERALSEEQNRLRQLFHEAPSFMAMLVGPEHRFEFTNAEYLKVVGHTDVLGMSVAEMIGEETGQGFVAILDKVFQTGETYTGRNARYAIQETPGAPAHDRYIDFVYQAMRDSHGKIFGIFVNGIDVTERHLSDITRDILHRELVHRIKNTLAITSAVVTASMRQAGSLEEARETIAARIDALGRSQSLLTRPQGEVQINELIQEALEPHIDDWARVTIRGPSVLLSAQQAVGLSLAVYELATNAIKYGALSVPDGRVSITWSINEENNFLFRWQESNGPAVQSPTRSGFGSRLTNRIVAAYFSGKGETTYNPAGLLFELEGILGNDTEVISLPE